MAPAGGDGTVGTWEGEWKWGGGGGGGGIGTLHYTYLLGSGGKGSTSSLLLPLSPYDCFLWEKISPQTDLSGSHLLCLTLVVKMLCA